MDTQTKPELGKPKAPDSIGLDIIESSAIDIGLNTFNQRRCCYSLYKAFICTNN